MRPFRRLAVALLCLMPVLALAQPFAPKDPAAQGGAEAQRHEASAAWRAAMQAAVRAPGPVPLRDVAALTLPPGTVFVPQPQAARLSRAMGNQPRDSLLGIVAPLGDAEDWLVFVSFVPDGYVRDDEARELDADQVLAGLRDATEEGNKDREARGFASLDILGWDEPPRYDAATHRLSWAAALADKGTGANRLVNYNTRVLGREGYLSINMVTEPDALPRDRGAAAALLDGVHYGEGRAYADFNGSTDRVATYGLLALIGVAAAKKLGLLALLAAFLLKFAKVGVLAVVGAGLALRRMAGRRPRP